VFLAQDERGGFVAIKQFPVGSREQMQKAKDELEIWVFLQFKVQSQVAEITSST